MALQYAQLVPGSVVVTLSEALTTLFVEELDYQVDYAQGMLRRLAGGTIPDQQPVIGLLLVLHALRARRRLHA